MRQERQIEFVRQVAEAGPGLTGLFGPASMVNPASHYTDPANFQREMQALFATGPVYFGLSCELPEPGSFLTGVVAGTPIAVVRQEDRTLKAMVNVCRHRGAPVLEGRGEGVHRLVCPYHAWTYDLDGTLHGRPRSDGAFDDVTLNCNLHPVQVAEKHGLIYVRVDGRPVDVDAALDGALDDLSAFNIEGYTHVETRTNTWNVNWKLILDTFTESYHIRMLHKDSIAATFLADPSIFEAMGRNLLSVGLRRTVADEVAKPEAEWSIIPYGTIQYFLVPSGLVVHQVDHIEAWRVTPIDVNTTEVSTGVFAPTPPATEKATRYWLKNLDLLLTVTESEDFPLMEKIQKGLTSGAVPEVVYGRNEPALVYLHQRINAAVYDPATG